VGVGVSVGVGVWLVGVCDGVGFGVGVTPPPQHSIKVWLTDEDGPTIWVLFL
jgi:hypothetical protein